MMPSPANAFVKSPSVIVTMAISFFVNMKLEQNNNTSENAEPEQKGLSVFPKEGLFIF